MLDATLNRLTRPALTALARGLAGRGVPADAMTFLALAFGLICAAAVALGWDAIALAALALGRLCDGLDGAVARAGRPTDRGAFLDIVFDFAFYGAVPLAFALRDPGANGLPACALLFAFYVNGASFLAFASLAAKRGLETEMGETKGIVFTRGFMEGSETIAFFAAMMLWPAWFPVLATAFAGLTLMSFLARVGLAWHAFRDALPVDNEAA